jgi:hypothetical protein
LYPDYWNDIRKMLLEQGIIETDFIPWKENGKKNVLKGIGSIGYRLTQSYQGKHIKVLQDSDSTFIKKLKKQESNPEHKMDAITKKVWFHLQDIGIYKEQAEEYVNQWYLDKLNDPSEKLQKKLVKQNKRNMKKYNQLKKKGKQVSTYQLTYGEMLLLMKESYLQQIEAVEKQSWVPEVVRFRFTVDLPV